MKSHPSGCRGVKALWLAALLSLAAPALQAEPYYSNPVIAGDYPDPTVIRVGDEYWAMSTSSEWGPHYPILHSKDLVNWEIVGSVFSQRPEWAVANFWAPELAEYKGRYFNYYTARKRGGPLAVAVATADHPAGPWTDHGPMVAQEMGSIDAVAFTGEDGKRYLSWKEDGNSRRQPTVMWIQEMNDEGTKLLGEPRELIRNDVPWEGAVVEGAFFVRHGAYFYMFYAGGACCGRGCNYAQGVARSKSLLGPYEKNPANPIMAGNELWRCPGHGSVVQDKQGRYFLMYHAYSAKDSVYAGRQAMLDEIVFQDGWPVINNGKGPSHRAVSPHGAVQRKTELAFHDEFTSEKLRPGWQWPQADRPVYQLDSANGGQLILGPKTEAAQDITALVLARSSTTGDYVATTSVDLAPLGTKGFAGLSAFGDRANAIGVAVGTGKVVLWRRERGKQENLAEISAPPGEKIHLQLAAQSGHRFRFAASADGRVWHPVGNDVEGSHLPPWDRSVRVALTAGGAEDAQARFDFLKVIPAK
jgi:xylan 1,4-beta-xylosidase